MRFAAGPPSLAPKDVLRWVIAVALGAMALGSLVTLVVVGAGKLGVELMPTAPMRLFIATTAWYSLISWAVTILGFGGCAWLLVRRQPGALWCWLAGYVSAFVVQLVETNAAKVAGAEPDPSGYGILVILALAGWGVYTIERGKRPKLPPRAMKR